MLVEESAPGLALMCNKDGVILKVLHNDLGISNMELLGRPFPVVVQRSSFTKALAFLAELHHRGSNFDWEFNLSLGGTLVLAHCAGLKMDDGLLIMAARSRTAVNLLVDDMMRINNEHTNLSRVLTKEQIESERGRGGETYDQMSAVNNELASLQRELAKKNAELHRLNAEVSRLSIMDDLTGIYNRRGFFEIGRREVERARRGGSPLAAVMIDLDHFKRVNDTHGHAVGDRVLVEVAARCGKLLRKVDVLGRYGGEEFSILLPDTKPEAALVIAERLRLRIADEPILTENAALTITISLGIANLTASPDGLDEVLDRADRALYKAKELGRNRVCTDAD